MPGEGFGVFVVGIDGAVWFCSLGAPFLILEVIFTFQSLVPFNCHF
jgi:hypothetical protein